ncbi:MAG: hypothetical protein AB1634_09810 [Thermodesulfobacteriota bacterium]
MPPSKRFFVVSALLLISMFMRPAAGLAEQETRPLPEELTTAITHLLALTTQDRPVVDPELAGRVVSFVAEAPDADYSPPAVEDTTAAFCRFDLPVDLERFLGYMYNPAIPGQVFSPSSLRTASYLPVAGEIRTPPAVWDLTAARQGPQTIRVAEHEEITPDQFTGAYYGYDVDRTLILLEHQGRPAFLSVARQRDVSDVGKKGAALGSSQDWDYLYSGEKGLTKTGLGWVDSFMYRAFSIAVYVPPAGQPQALRCGVLKWLNAGWAGINMVQRHHILAGMERYIQDLRLLMAAPQLPSAQSLGERFAAFGRLSQADLQDRTRTLLGSLHRRYADHPLLDRDTFAAIFDSDSYVAGLTREQMLAALGLEALKCALDRSCQAPEVLLDTERADSGRPVAVRR